MGTQGRFSGARTIALAAGFSAALSASPVVAVPEPGVRWVSNQVGLGIGRGLDALDLVGDDAPDLLTIACGISCWAVFSDFGSGLRIGATALPDSEIFDVTGLPQREGGGGTVLALREGRVDVYSTTSPLLDRSFVLPPSEWTGLMAADLEGDGTFEVIVRSEFDLLVLDFESGDVEQLLFGFGGTELALGNTDADGHLEIALASGLGSCWLLDGESLTLDWATTSGCGPRIALVDTNGDGRDEVVTNYPGFHGVRLFDPSTDTIVFTASETAWEPRFFAAEDIDGDGDEEILFGDAQSGGVHALDGTGTEVWYVPDSQGGIGPIVTGNLNGTGSVEVVWVKGSNVVGGPYGLGIAQWPAETISATLMPTGGGGSAFDVGDLEGDGRLEIATLARTVAGTTAAILDARDGIELRTLVPAGEQPWRESGWALRLGSVASGGASLNVLETLVEVYQPMVACQDAVDGSTRWTVELPMFNELLALETADIDADSVNDVVFTAGNFLNSEAYVYAHETDTGGLKWRTPELGGFGFPPLLAICQLDSDLPSEIVLASTQVDILWVIDGETGDSLARVSPDASGLVCHDLNGDGLDEIFASSWTGELGVVDPDSGDLLVQNQMSDPVYSLALGDFLARPGLEMLSVVGQRLVAFDPATFEPLWQSADLGPSVAYGVSRIVVEDLDNDGSAEAVVSTWSGLVVLGRVYSGPELLSDGFESGDTVRWSSAVRHVGL